MTTSIEERCKQKGVKLTDQRKLVAQIMSRFSMTILMLMNYTREFLKLIQKLALQPFIGL